ncbi:MAG: UDP-2,3-diacylglucosamine diphosphatase [Gemmatimonadota bacterium]|nr:MAG: UDP-2,3-diacylglucosamine diphosphatase [Gemmatimonadota bacterium]
MPSQSVTVAVADAHLGPASGELRESFHRFLATVPDIGDHLLINGDLFDFWFEYRHVIPRSCFATLAALSGLRQSGIAITVTGGNHDRWGAGFWENELGARFHRSHARMQLAGWNAWVAHGDGIVELEPRSRALHAITRHPLTERLFRMVHPDLGFGLVNRMSQRLTVRRNPELIAAAARSQAQFARDLLEQNSDLDLVVMGHTHRAVLDPVAERRWYVNPGAWCEGKRYALISAAGPELKTF